MTTLVLLIDADIPFMVNIKKALEDTGEFSVSLAANIDAAVDALRRVAHDAAVVDFEASDRGDVMELLQTLRQTQPGIPVIITPRTDVQHERAHLLDVQGVIARPYTARSLMPYVRDVLRRGRPHAQITPPAEHVSRTDDFTAPEIPAALRDLFPEETEPDHLLDENERRKLREQLEYLESDPGSPPASPADILDEFEAIERAQTGRLDDPPATHYPDDEGIPHPGDPYATRYLNEDDNISDARDLHVTHYFDDDDIPDSPPDTTTLEQPAPPATRHLGGTEKLDARAERATRPLGPRLDEPPPKEGDTPTVPDQDLEGVRQFLATDRSEHDPAEFGEVLDAVAHSQPSDFERSPDDRAFHDLVDSMRGPEESSRQRTWLDELLSSIAVDASRDAPPPDASGALDYVLDVIRQNVAEDELSGETDLDDTTIGEVIDGLFEPSFESVLAALSGEEIEVEDYNEPSYESINAESQEPDDDRVMIDETPDEDRPEWLSLYEIEEVEPPPTLPEEAPIQEPPITPEDSSKYPATAVLSAAESDDDFSFDDLLSQIESQLPPNLAGRPHLKPLPSWGTKALRAPEVNALFDRAEGIQPEKPDPGELAEAMSDVGPQTFEELTVSDEQDTRPSATLRDEIESASFQDRDTQPYGPIIPEEARARPIEVWENSASVAADEIPMLSMDDLLAMADLPAEAGTEEIQTEIARRAQSYEAPPADEYDIPDVLTDDQPDESPFSVSDDEIVRAFYAGVRGDPPPEPGESFEPQVVEMVEPDMIIPDDEHLIPVPVEEAARYFEGDTYLDEEAEEAEIAQAAVQLTQFSLESSAQATMLSRPGRLLAVSGELPNSDALFKIVDEAWQTTTTVSDSLIRFINLPEMGEFLLYSAQVENGMTLSMIFHADTPVRAIRRQARRLRESLDLIPETPEPPAAKTSPSRPTGLRPPEGLHEAITEQQDAITENIPARPAADDSGPYATYTCLWLPFDPGLELQGDLVSGLSTWLQDITQENAWELEELDIWPDYLLLTLSVPQKLLPDDVMVRLMDETNRLSADYFPDLVEEGALWADGYYVVAPARPLTEREIARFVTYQRQSQTR